MLKLHCWTAHALQKGHLQPQVGTVQEGHCHCGTGPFHPTSPMQASLHNAGLNLSPISTSGAAYQDGAQCRYTCNGAMNVHPDYISGPQDPPIPDGCIGLPSWSDVPKGYCMPEMMDSTFDLKSDSLGVNLSDSVQNRSVDFGSKSVTFQEDPLMRESRGPGIAKRTKVLLFPQ